MEEVLSATDLLQSIYGNIKDASPEKAARALASFAVVNSVASAACKQISMEVWFALLNAHFAPWLATNAGALSLAITKADLHPRCYIYLLCEATRPFRMSAQNMLPWPHRSSVRMPRVRFIQYMTVQYNAEKQAYLASPDRDELNKFPNLFNWIQPQWAEQPDWRRQVFFACYYVEMHHQAALRELAEEERAAHEAHAATFHPHKIVPYRGVFGRE